MNIKKAKYLPLLLLLAGSAVQAQTQVSTFYQIICNGDISSSVTEACDISGSVLTCTYNRNGNCGGNALYTDSDDVSPAQLVDVYFTSGGVCARDSADFLHCWNKNLTGYPPISMALVFNNDLDADGIENTLDNCLVTANIDQRDNDGDTVGDACDSDLDNDGFLNYFDDFPLAAAAAVDTDSDGMPDDWLPACDVVCQLASGLTLDADDDGDGVPDITDNCSLVVNPGQEDTDGDGLPNVCGDNDDDNDGVTDYSDRFPLNLAAAYDSDIDGYPDSWLAACNLQCQTNSGLVIDNCRFAVNTNQLDTDVDGAGDVCDLDDDNDGRQDAFDNCPLVSNTNQLNQDRDTLGDVCDANPSIPEMTSAIDTTWFHSCALTDAGAVKCWGSNNYGQLGNNSTTNRSTPEGVAGLNSGVNAISAGAYHSCSVTSAGAVKCWGRNDSGQLGNGSVVQSITPTNVTGLNSGVIKIAAGPTHSCALTSAGGVKCWGSNGKGELGNNSTVNSFIPVDVQSLSSGVVAIATGSSHSCALTAVGAVKCWGYNVDGQLGSGVGLDSHVPKDVTGLDSGVVAIAAGESYTCAVINTGGVKCWGDNLYGRLGDNTTVKRHVPVDVVGLNNAIDVAASRYHTCALTDMGSVKCWGNNGAGQLGDNSTTNRYSPVSVIGLSEGVNAIAVGYGHSCALTTAQGVKCWGLNSVGQLGDGTTSQHIAPADVSGFSGDTDSDGIGNILDWDDDNDAVPDTVDAGPLDNTNVTEIVLPLNSTFKGGQQSGSVTVQ